MATFITHGIFASSLIFLWRQKESRFKLFLLIFVASIIPDIDLFFGSHSRLFGHRGFTHSFFFAFLIATLFSAMLLREVKNFFHTIILFFIFFVATSSHLFLDAMTEAQQGVCFFCPFSEDRTFFAFKPFSTFTGGFSVRSKNSLLMQYLFPEILIVWLPSISFFSIMIYLENKFSPVAIKKKDVLVFKPAQQTKKNTTTSKPKTKTRPKKN
jgi:inner membrane protein